MAFFGFFLSLALLVAAVGLLQLDALTTTGKEHLHQNPPRQEHGTISDDEDESQHIDPPPSPADNADQAAAAADLHHDDAGLPDDLDDDDEASSSSTFSHPGGGVGSGRRHHHSGHTPEEDEAYNRLRSQDTRARLAAIVDIADTNKDGQLTKDELVAYMVEIQAQHNQQVVDKRWHDMHLKDNDTLTLEHYKSENFGHPEADGSDGGHTQLLKDVIQRDEKRFRLADGDGDGALSKREFFDFVHPEFSEKMHDNMVDETLADMDKGKDGVISLEEYIGDRYKKDREDEVEPDWVEKERVDFKELRDMNKDGHLDREEIRHWISPKPLEFAELEAKDLIEHSDTSKDGILSKDEILHNYQLFVASQLTSYGEGFDDPDNLLRLHDEL